MSEGRVAAVLLMEYENKEEADKNANIYKQCPHVFFWSNYFNQATVILNLPEAKKTWAEYIEKYPETTLGALTAQLVYQDKVYTPDKLEKLDKSVVKRESPSPCGSDCNICVSFQNDCPGCPVQDLT